MSSLAMRTFIDYLSCDDVFGGVDTSKMTKRTIRVLPAAGGKMTKRTHYISGPDAPTFVEASLKTSYTQKGVCPTPMTTDERFQRIEHVTAALAEERTKDREQHRQLWRDTQRQLNEVGIRLGELTIKIADNQDAIAAERERAHAAEQALREQLAALGDRIATLVSAMGELIRPSPAT